MSLKVKFLGALGTVTGSCSLLHYERTDSYFLVDCGMYQGIIGASERNQRPFPFDPKRIGAVLLTHAHIDHCGLLPRLVEEGFTGDVICTRVTAEIARNSLRDAARLEGWFSPSSASQINFRCPDDKDDFQLGHYYPLAEDLFFAFLRTAHIVGSVAIELRHNVNKDEHINVLFSGDIGPSTDGAVFGGLVKARQYPNPNTTFIISESTYGNRCRESRCNSYEGRIKALGQTLQESLSVESNPTVIFPCFSLQRTQDLLIDLHYLFDGNRQNRSLDIVPPTVYVDSSLAEAQTQAILQEFRRVNSKGKENFLNAKHPAFADKTKKEILSFLESALSGSDDVALRTLWESPPENEGHEPMLIISSSGMCNGGPVVNHLQRHISNSATTIVLTGHQSPGTPGGALLKLMDMHEQERNKFKFKLGEIEVNGSDFKARVVNLASFFSGHADQDGLIDFILRRDSKKPYNPVTVFLNHGDNIARQALKKKLVERAESSPDEHRPLKEVYTPKLGDGWFNFESSEWQANDPGSDDESKFDETISLMSEIRDSNIQIIDLLQQLLNNRKE